MPTLPDRYQPLLLRFSENTYHAGGEEDPRLDIVKRDIARHLTDSVSDGEDSIDLIKLIPSKAQLFSHSGDVSIVQIAAIW